MGKARQIMRLFPAFLVGSVLAQERLPAAQTACAAFRDEIKANNTIAGDGVWQCPKLSKETKKTACKATCPGNKVPEFKKASFKVKCGIEKDVNGTVTPTPSWSDSIKQKPADGTLACHDNLCSVGTENGLISKGSRERERLNAFQTLASSLLRRILTTKLPVSQQSRENKMKICELMLLFFSEKK